jgi:hypothetical protein
MQGWPYQPGGRGPRLVAENVLMRLMHDWKDFGVRAEHYFADGNAVIAIGRYAGVHHQPERPLTPLLPMSGTLPTARLSAFAGIPTEE